MRRLSDSFLHDLKEGLLAPLLKRVHQDHTLCLELREEYVVVYYRGGALATIRKPSGYRASMDANYLTAEPRLASQVDLTSPEDVSAYIASLAERKQAMDLLFSTKRPEEREAQQLLARDNNVGRSARATDVYVCDLEYAVKGNRFDFIGVEWPSNPSARKRQTGHRLVLAEIKFGDGALEGSAGLHQHLDGINACLSDAPTVQALKSEMVGVFNQKRDLGLIDCDKDLKSFNDAPPLLLLVLVNHDPDKTRLRELLGTLPECPHVEVRFASASLFGYGLFAPAMLTLDEALLRVK